ncbi:right-handed parallel beta-helix repeat-containing protein [Streptomyces sp. NBC_01020]|uniref:right-handed parallel beta-helix repeat-containing protein n=1 Tax=Streptomyces sp. NBC_01020 TaxID=2903722 RepID=UPI003863A108|nr:right-handed parallel beta-helix repeat-containing protein [Streptomyces sp. NBC_01020]
MLRELLRTKAVLTTLAAAVAGLAPTAAAAQHHTGTTYYVDCRDGSDSAPGTSAARAWHSLAKASRAYAPGDRLLLRRGRSCTGTLAPTGSGTAAEPIRLGAYGTGAKPHIEGAGARAAVLLRDSEGWEVRDLDLSDTGPATTTDRRAGLLVLLRDFGVGHHYVVDGVDVHDVNGSDSKDPDPSGGILFVVQGSDVPTRFDGVRITDSTVRHTDRTGIGTSSTWSHRAENPDGTGSSWQAITGLVIDRNKVSDAGGDGIVVQNARGALVEHNRVDGFNMRSAAYNAGVWAWNSDDVLYQYNEVSGGHGTRDSMAYDIDGANTRNVYRYNYSHDNEGGFLLVCNGATTTTDGNRVHDNTSINDRNTSAPYGVISVVCGSTTDTRVYRNTVVTDRPGTAMVSDNGQTGVTFSDNVFVGAAGGSPVTDTLSTYSGNLYWNTAQPRDPAAVEADPLLRSAHPTAPDDVRLRPGSPARGAGTPVDDGTVLDYFGHRIPARPNLGADQGR